MATRLYSNSNPVPADYTEVSALVSNASLYSDSMEVAKMYYDGKLQELEKQLNNLTIQEHPTQIVAIARQILSVKAILRAIAVR